MSFGRQLSAILEDKIKKAIEDEAYALILLKKERVDALGKYNPEKIKQYTDQVEGCVNTKVMPLSKFDDGSYLMALAHAHDTAKKIILDLYADRISPEDHLLLSKGQCHYQCQN